MLPKLALVFGLLFGALISIIVFLFAVIAFNIGQVCLIFFFLDNDININYRRIFTMPLMLIISLIKTSIFVFFIGLICKKLIFIKYVSKKTIYEFILLKII